LALDGREWSASHQARFTMGKETMVGSEQEGKWEPQPVSTLTIRNKSVAPTGNHTTMLYLMFVGPCIIVITE